MELSKENLKTPRYWLELPLEIGRAVCSEIVRDVDVLLEKAAELPEQE